MDCCVFCDCKGWLQRLNFVARDKMDSATRPVSALPRSKNLLYFSLFWSYCSVSFTGFYTEDEAMFRVVKPATCYNDCCMWHKRRMSKRVFGSTSNCQKLIMRRSSGNFIVNFYLYGVLCS